MGEFGGGGADNLDFSGHTYEQLRAAVYGVSEEAVRVAGNEWADLKRRLNERVGTLHVVVAKLAPAWDSPAGQQALEGFRAQRDWMAELARVAGLNEAQLDEVQTTRIEAVNAMRALDSQPGGPVPPGSRPRPAPSPGPAPGAGGWVDPASLDWRQPRAADIANRLYGRLAIAAASMAKPPANPQLDPFEYGASPDTASGTNDGPRYRSGNLTGGPGSTVSRPGSGPVPPGVPAGTRSSSGRRDPGNPRPATGNPVAAPGTGGRREIVSPGYVPVQGSSGGTAGRGPTFRDRGVPAVGRGGVLGGRPPGVGGTTGHPTVGEPPGKVLGGGLRPPPGPPVPPAPVPGEVPPPAGGIPGAGGAAGQPDRRGRRRPGYERADPGTFVDSRPGNAAGGKLPTPGGTPRFAPLPGTVGQQKPKPAEDDPHRDVWEVPETRSPEGFPEKLATFTRRDGVTFEVRRARGGT